MPQYTIWIPDADMDVVRATKQRVGANGFSAEIVRLLKRELRPLDTIREAIRQAERFGEERE